MMHAQIVRILKNTLLYFSLCTGPLLAADDAKLLFETRCVACHALPDPESLGEKQWLVVLKTMQKRMREKGHAELTEAEFKKIYCYLAGRGEPCSGGR